MSSMILNLVGSFRAIDLSVIATGRYVIDLGRVYALSWSEELESSLLGVLRVEYELLESLVVRARFWVELLSGFKVTWVLDTVADTGSQTGLGDERCKCAAVSMALETVGVLSEGVESGLKFFERLEPEESELSSNVRI